MPRRTIAGHLSKTPSKMSALIGWRNPTRCNCMQIFIYC